MTIEELVDSHGVTLAYFDNELWQRPGMIIDELKIVFVNKALSEEAQKRVILHEIAHLNHSATQYTINPIRCENEANRAMIRALIREELDEGHEFNYIRFMDRHNLKTTTDEIMVVDEYFSLIG